MLHEKNRYETDFVSFILEHEGLEVAGDRYGISHAGNFSVSTEDGQKNTVYMGRCPVEDGKVSVPWEKFFIKKDGGKNVTFTAFRQTAGKSAERGKENDMGIISALLSGGILIGKICQGISGALSSMVSDEKKGLAASTDNLEFDNLKFMMLKGSSDTQPKLYALNCSSDLKMVQFPADKNGNCLCYAVQGGEKVQIEDSVTAANPTDVVEISTSEDNSAADGFTAMKVLLNSLTIGSSAEVNVYGYRFAAEEDGIRILGGKASSLDYIALTSESGIRVTSTDSITPASVSDDLFPFSFKDCGLKTGDVLSGELHFTSASNALLLKNAIASESLTEEEKEFLTGIGVLK